MKPSKGIAVDGSCIGNPGPGKYRGIDLSTGELLFSHNLRYTTNNIAEFIGLCHSVFYALEHNTNEVYTDSYTAIAWLKNKKANSILFGGNSIGLIRYSEEKIKPLSILSDGKSLKINDKVMVHKWDTKKWGEIPADYNLKN